LEGSRPGRPGRIGETVNTQLIALYWSIGKTILERQATEGWGSGVIGRLAEDLGAEFPDMKGLSRSNLQYMRSFAEAWPAFEPVAVILG
jgi:predicted nuclease of restriction endonuclease-like (RecB) superfamily